MVDPLSRNLANNLQVSPETGLSSDITRFFQDTNKNSLTSNSEEFEPEDSSNTVIVNIPPYSTNFKPPTSEKKKYVYSINELLSYSKAPASEAMQDLIDSLPKKKFWRFGRRFSDQGAHKNTGQKNGNRSPNSNSNSNPKNKIAAGEDASFDRKNSKGKNSRVQHPKRGNKFGKSERSSYMEEKDITVNNDDLLALEENFEHTGNSMADFESWKAKMKEMERKKKGISDTKLENIENKASLSSTSSSISDFLKLNNKNNEADNNNNIDRTDNVEKRTIEEEKADKQNDGLKNASRFSSFFTQSSSNTSLPSTNATTNGTEPAPVGNTKTSENSASGSRLLSFFHNNDPQKPKEEATAKIPNKSSADNAVHSFVQPPRPLPGAPIMSPLNPVQRGPVVQQSQTNNVFFQGLLNRGKIPESNISAVSSPEMALPPGLGRMSHPSQIQQPSQSQQPQKPPQGPLPPGFPMGMSPANFPPPFHGGSQVPSYLINESMENGKNSKSLNSNGKSNMRQRQGQPPPGVIRHQIAPGMVPPGFPPMQGPPPNFNPSMYGPPNGMIQPNGQHFYPPMPPPPVGNMHFSPFKIPSMPEQQENRPNNK